eukprot:COSAG02_NODE_708_length_18231_cov_53.208416_2_plen_131_part_00
MGSRGSCGTRDQSQTEKLDGPSYRHADALSLFDLVSRPPPSALCPPPRSLMQPPASRLANPTCCSLEQAYFGVFTASTVALLRSHLSDPYWHPVRNPLVILAFGFLALFYGWFALFQKPVVFEGLPKTVQ